ncbi:HPr-rel-A system PqqD family peptide chaperone [Accumulibacter sp.]|uniref:HPr-rel-A system PqqD family peptide chaperone n=1 Tax=Accumulibacter sp. TaxID=2053492 RepID=UPI0025CCD674|nr:HPr-rel-A system PqqD family peptide chaperone [Accumulibacter sp.]MCM8595780.1 HPr-rel-A system PqqD family peptide chaperone [Accumulibacter sp.]MCM8626501.1 HPr-rel-A system PqqD family peptide chaperone [Accumulibacter sp.]MDS4049928.1 HPr-rel-A system PqqD family peptide chaperone [Accumulibacter sp.]
MGNCQPDREAFVLAEAARSLIWQAWDEVYIIYQASSAETHVFNETTALILRSLEQGPLLAEGTRNRVEAALGLDPGELVEEDFAFALARLEELGLIDRLDPVSPVDDRR